MSYPAAPPMPGQSRPAFRFAPKDQRTTLGGRLKQMQMEGRRIIESEMTRWRFNRAFFVGHQYLQVAPSGNSIRSLAPTALLRNGMRRDTVNRLRQMVEGRISVLTFQKPAGEVIPPSQDQDAVDGARMGSKLFAYEYDNPRGLNLAQRIAEIALWGEQDGIAWLNVLYDKNAGPKVPVAIDAETGQPITDRARLEEVKEEDPAGQALWREVLMPLGQVKARTVRCATLSVDPAMTTDFSECRWIIERRVRAKSEIERQYGVDLEALVRRERQMGSGQMAPEATMVMADTSGFDEQHLPGRDFTVEYCLYALAHGDFPEGAHVVWVNEAASSPLLAEPYDDDELPYFPYVPKPSGGHLLRSRATVDELIPIQVRFNRTVSQAGEIHDLQARPMLKVPIGTLRTENVFNEKRIVEYQPGLGEVSWLQYPPDVNSLMNELVWLENQMSEIATLPAPTRGQTPGQGVDAFQSLNFLSQNAEIQLGQTVQALTAVLNWAGSRFLKLVGRYYDIPRLVNAPGVDDEEEFASFVGNKLRGCYEWRVTQPLTPRNRAGQIQMLTQFMQYAGEQGFAIAPYIADLLEGNPDEIINHEKAQERRQKRENRLIASYGAHPDRDRIWQEFTVARDRYVQVIQQAAAVGIDPQQALAEANVRLPRVSDFLRDAGLPYPKVEDYDRDPEHLMALDDFSVGDGFDRMHDLVKQLAREHRQDHVAKLGKTMQAMGQQVPADQSQQPQPTGIPKIIESINFKDLPPSSQAALLQEAGIPADPQEVQQSSDAAQNQQKLALQQQQHEQKLRQQDEMHQARLAQARQRPQPKQGGTSGR